MVPRALSLVSVAASIFCALLAGNAAAQSAKPIHPDKARVIEHWTSERRAAAIPRDLVIDPRGLGYLRRPDGSLVPHGHDIAAQAPSKGQTPSPFAKPGGGSGDTAPPAIAGMIPAEGTTIGASQTFSATVTDSSGIRSVTFKVQKDGSTVQSFSPANTSGNTWAVALQGFTNGTWKWWVEAKDGGPRGGNAGSSAVVNFQVSTGGGGGGGGGGSSDTVTNAEWTAAGTVQTAAGRIYFEMPNNANRTGPWWGYVCSGTVADDSGASDRSVIITAAHCVYDDANKAFARNIIFIPDQDGTTGSGTDRNCANDPIGCWVPSQGVVDVNWTTRTFPDNIAWDYGFYVVRNTGAHQAGISSTSEALDVAARFLPIRFAEPFFNDGEAGAGTSDFTHALGYSYSDDPNFMYCAEDMTTEGAVNWWLPSCLLSGGSSGGPWLQPMNTTMGSGDIISVNSWGYTNSPGMAGPKLSGTSAVCVFGTSTSAPFPGSAPPDGDAGIKVTCP
jgi:hypothetical protein